MLPARCSTDASTIPSEVPYLWADPELTEQWRAELAGIEGFKIGIVWQGSRDYSSIVGDRFRWPILHRWPALPGVRLVSLQKGFGAEQIATVDFPVLDLAGRLDETAGPFMDTAAVIRNLDLVVTPDTAIGHLAGALGVPVWLAIQFSPNWAGCSTAKILPGIPPCDCSAKPHWATWPDVFERAWPRPPRRAA